MSHSPFPESPCPTCASRPEEAPCRRCVYISDLEEELISQVKEIDALKADIERRKITLRELSWTIRMNGTKSEWRELAKKHQRATQKVQDQLNPLIDLADQVGADSTCPFCRPSYGSCGCGGDDCQTFIKLHRPDCIGLKLVVASNAKVNRHYWKEKPSTTEKT